MTAPTAAVPLRTATLGGIGERVAVPTYDRSAVRTGVVHFGVGGFHRAHLAAYHDELLRAGAAGDWGICGAGVLESDRRIKEVLDAQDGLYTLVLKHADGMYEPRVIGAIIDVLLALDDREALVARLADAGTRIVSLTITEGGYDADNPTFALIAEALAVRRERGLSAFTVMSCDNLPGNGDRTRAVLTASAADREAGLASWIAREVAFPNAMVDRITPQTTEEDRREVRERFGIDDLWPVVCEPFTQWVLEDCFSAGHPPYDLAGAQLVDDVEPYELMKLRLLNAGHQALCYFARLCDYRLVHEAAQDPVFAAFLRDYMDLEATPTLEPVPGVDLPAYKATLLERFSNPEIRDTVARLCADSSDRIPGWLLPVVRRNLAAGGEVTRSAAIVAGWARYAEGIDEHGDPIEIVDNRRARVTDLARAAQDDPVAFLAEDLFGDLAADERFTAPFRAAWTSLHERGTRATLTALVAGPEAVGGTRDG